MSDKSTEIVELLTPTVESLGLQLLGVEYLPAPCGALLRLYIDLPEGSGDERQVGIEDCERVSHEVSAQLDVEDPIASQYTLEVSSPGVDRPLFNAAHFAKFIGESAKVVLKLPQEGRRRLTGRIVSVENNSITFDIDGAAFIAAADNIEKARLVPNWEALGLVKHKPGHGPKKPKAAKPSSQPNQHAASAADDAE